MPLVGDFHYNGHTLLSEFPDCAEALAKYRINPGNVGRGARHDANFATMVQAAIDHRRPVRIGVNAGSLDPELLDALMDENGRRDEPLSADAVLREAMVQSAISSAEAAEEIGLPAYMIVLSCKTSRLQDMVAVYRDLAARCSYPLHLGPDRGRHGQQGHRLDHRGPRHPAAGRHRRHDPREPHPRARRRPHHRGARVPRDPPEPRACGPSAPR